MANQFEDYLHDQQGLYQHRSIALTDRSYKNVDHNQTTDENRMLATYGDALLKLALCQILFERNIKNITVEKQPYESDEHLVKIVAKEYGLLEYIHFDDNDKKIPQDYDYNPPSKRGKDSTHKYIATALEALLAAFYLDHQQDFGLVVEVVEDWKRLIDRSLQRSCQQKNKKEK